MLKRLLVLLAAVACTHTAPQPQAAEAAHEKTWIERSNENAMVLLHTTALFQPEIAARSGMPGIDENVFDLQPGHRARQRAAVAQAQAELEKRLAAERDPLVAQDLQILIDAAKRQIKGSELNERLLVAYFPLPRVLFQSVFALLDPQVAPSRRPAALVRVRKYAGLETGTTPVVQLAEAETREGLAKGLLPPPRIELENDLETAQHSIAGIEQLFKKYAIPGYEEPVAVLRKQLESYMQFVRTELMPKAREDFRLPPELYQFQLTQVGVDIPAAELTQKAHAAFT